MSKVKCGIIMPISEMDSYTKKHWADVKKVIQETTQEITSYDIECDLVSGVDNTGIIHTEIVQNIQNSEIIICDVSGNNPNVLFELGLRLASNKPTIVIKDNTTDYIFDISPIHHIEYDKNFNMFEMKKFMKDLSSRVEKELKQKNKSRNTYYNSFSIYSEKEDQEVDIFDLNKFDDDERLFLIYIKEKENYIFNNMDVVPQDLILWEKENNLNSFTSERYKLILKKLLAKEFFKITNNSMFEETDYGLKVHIYSAIKENIKKYPEKVNGLKIKYRQKETKKTPSSNVNVLDESIKLYLVRNSSKSKKTIRATALFNSKGYLVLKDSEIELIDSSSIPPKIKVARKNAQINEQGILLKDVLFSSPSSAAEFVVGGYTNGRMDWKNKEGKTLKEIQEENEREIKRLERNNL